MSLDPIADVTIDTLLSQAALKLREGYRWVTMTCLAAGEGGYDILYHFDKAYQLSTLRLHLAPGQELPSISGLCFCAVLAENEIKDFFGLTLQGLAIDFKGRLLLSEDAPKAPLSKPCGIGLDVRDKTKPGKGESS